MTTIHQYQRDPQSGAGNCICGAAENHVKHPHTFLRAYKQESAGSATRCVCSRQPSDPIHIVT